MSDILIVAPDDSVTIEQGGASDGSSQSGSDGGGGQNSGDSQGDGSGQEDGGDQAQKKNGLEWVVFAIGVAITLGTIGYLVYELATETGKPPTLEITLTEQRSDGAVLAVDVEAENTGDTVAEGAVIEVCGGADTCAMLNIPYVPAGSTRSGTVGLSLPLSGPLETRAVSFRTP